MSFPQGIQNPTAISLSGVSVSTWTTLSAGTVPAGCTGMIAVLSVGNGNYVRDFRAVGSSETATAVGTSNAEQYYELIPLNSSGQFQYYTTNTTPTTDVLTPLVWLGPEWTFLTPKVAMPAMTTTLATYSTGGNAPGAVAAAFKAYSGGINEYWVGHPLITPSVAPDGNANPSTIIAGLDGSQEFAGKCITSGVTPYLVAYCTGGYTGFTSGGVLLNVTPGTTGSNQNLPTDTGAVWAAYYGKQTTLAAISASPQGTTWTPPSKELAQQQGGMIVISEPAQINIPTTTSIYEIGYFSVPLVVGGGLLLTGCGS